MPGESSMDQDLGKGVPPAFEIPAKRPGRFVDRLGFVSRVALERVIKPPKVEGLEHLSEIPKGEKVVVACDHLADVSELAAIQALAPYRKADVASLATNQRDLKQAIPIRMLGRNRFHDVRNIFDKEKDKPYMSFDTSNFSEMKEAMDKGSDMVISAHRPLRRTETAVLPSEPTIGAVYLAQLTEGRRVVPVALDMHTEQRIGMAYKDVKGAITDDRSKGRSDATFRIGSTIVLDQIPKDDLDKFTKIGNSKSRAELRNTGQFTDAKEAYLRVRETLEGQSRQIMNAIADLLPEEKRNGWGNSNTNDNSGQTTT